MHQDLLAHNPLIFGAGRSGISAFKLLVSKGMSPRMVSQGDPAVWGASLNTFPESVGKLKGQEDQQAAAWFQSASVIILSPGIPRDHPLLTEGVSPNVPIINEIDLAWNFLDIPVVAVTGTNGKTTTVTMLEKMAERSPLKVFVGGNIGIPFCEAVLSGEKWDAAVLELSSFQLESLFELRLKGAAILNISPGHGERYSSTVDYADAKLRILELLDKDGSLWLPRDNGIVEKAAQLISTEKIHWFNPSSEELKRGMEKLFDFSGFQLPGGHNIINLFIAHKLADVLGIDKASQQYVIDTFRGVEHRLELVLKNDDVCVFNDSKSTNWASTLTALHCLGKLRRDYQGFTLMIGGKKRGNNDTIIPYAEEFKLLCDHIICFGEVGLELYEQGKEEGMNIEYVKELDGAVSFWRKSSAAKGLLLFSPAFPSFDMFGSYADRGNVFKECILSNQEN